MPKKLVIYKGNIHCLYADGITLNKEQIIPNVQEELITDQALFYRFMKKFINLDYSCVLPDREEALDYLNHVVENREGVLHSLFDNPQVPEEKKQNYLAALTRASSCLFFRPAELQPSFEVTKKGLKILQKEMLKKESR